jgi:lipopolysaccharide export LptBFGC system permease protein LptF
MTLILDYPLMLLFPVSFVVMGLAAWIGGWFAARRKSFATEIREDFNVIQAATLTLLGLIIGFTFSMALNRYDQRKNFEEEEANAIGTAYLRVDLLPAADATRLRGLLKQYVGERVRYYTTRGRDDLDAINARTAKLQDELWAAVRGPAVAQPSPISGLAVSSINDVINSQGYTQAAWWNRIPHAAWILLTLLALCANFLVGLGARSPKVELRLMMVFPIIVAAAFFLIADIDAPRGGVIRVAPLNLQALDQSLR